MVRPEGMGVGSGGRSVFVRSPFFATVLERRTLWPAMGKRMGTMFLWMRSGGSLPVALGMRCAGVYGLAPLVGVGTCSIRKFAVKLRD